MATIDSTKKAFTDTYIAALQRKDKIYTVADSGCTGLHVRVEKSGSKSWWLNLWTPEGAPKRQRYAWRLGDVNTFRLYAKRQATEKARQQSIRDYAEIIRAKALYVDLREAKRAAVAKNEAYKTETLQGFIDLVYADRYAVKNKRPDEMIKWLKSSFADLLPMKLDTITYLTIRGWMKKEMGKKKTPSDATIVRKLQLLSGVLTHAVVKKLITSHPLQSSERKVNAIKIPEVDNKRKRFLKPDEETRLRDALKARDKELKAARVRNIAHKEERGLTPPVAITGAYGDHLTPLILIAMNTGIRRGALLGLKWSAVSQGQIFVSKKLDKAGNGYSVSLSKEATEVLRLWKHQTGGKGLLFQYQGSQIKSIKTSWGKLLADAKITDFRFHDCRHHFASKLVMGGVDLYTVAQLMGHSSIEMTERYAHLSPDHMKDAMKVLNS